jgi:type VI secretion system protein ImpC
MAVKVGQSQTDIRFMSAKLTSASFELGVRPAPRSQPAASDLKKRFNIVVIGDFSGRHNRAVSEPVASRKLVPVDCDNLESAFARLGAGLKLSESTAGGPGAELAFAAMEDFHPDKLLTRAEPLARLFEARRLLLDPSTSEQGKAALQAYLGAAIGAPPAQSSAAAPAQAESDQDTLGRLLGGAAPAKAGPPTAASPVETFIRQVVAPHVAPAPASWQQGALDAVNLELAGKLRALLHHPDFQSLEAAWRGADLLVRHNEAVDRVAIFLLDVSAPELQAELLGPERGSPSPLFRLLREHNVSVIIGNLAFGQTADDLRALGRLAEFAADLRAPFIATASPSLVNCDSFGRHADPDDWKTALPSGADEAWQSLRGQPSAGHVGLVAPRFLLRQPYGKSGDPIDSFPFEELPGEAAHESFLWGHPAILCGCLLADAFEDEDAEFDPPACGEVGDMPVHKFTEEGETVIKPYAEAWLTERAAARIAARGIMAVLSRKDYNSVRLPGLYSIARSQDALPFRLD